MSSFYDRDGSPLELLEWGMKMEDVDYKRVALDIFENRFGHQTRVSTVWLGSNHNFDESGPPLIFESMAFDDDNKHETMGCEFSEDIDMERYTTLEQAQEGHRAMVAKWSA